MQSSYLTTIKTVILDQCEVGIGLGLGLGLRQKGTSGVNRSFHRYNLLENNCNPCHFDVSSISVQLIKNGSFDCVICQLVVIRKTYDSSN